MSDELAETTLLERVALLGIADAPDTPLHAGEVTRRCAERVDAVDGVVGTVTEAEVSRALNGLAAAGLVDERRDDTSPTGKGRPRYALDVDPGRIAEAFDDDDRLGELVAGLDD